MLRATVAVSLAVALPLAALGAPLVHAHLDKHGHEGHHGAARVHAHLGGHPMPHHITTHAHPDGPAVAEGEDPESATTLQLFVAVEPAPFAVPAMPRTRYVLPALLESIMKKPPAVAHSHDPPAAASCPPRAPPSSLS